MNFSAITQHTVSFCPNAWTPPTAEVSIQALLEDIRNGKYAGPVNYLRDLLASSKTDDYSREKLKLPAVTFCATFSPKRKREFIKAYNCLLVLDIDKLSELELLEVKQKLSNDPFVLAYWVSPSNNGVKGLVELAYDFPVVLDDIYFIHKQAFSQIQEYFTTTYSISLDKSGSDTTRLCLVSYDPQIVVKQHHEVFAIAQINLPLPRIKNQIASAKSIDSSERNKLFNPLNRNKPHDRIRIQSIIRFLKKRNLSITDDYNDWFKVGLAISNSFTHEIGEKYFISLSRNDVQKFNESRCKNMLLDCYKITKNVVRFNTIVSLAAKQGYKSIGVRGGSSLEGGVRKGLPSFSVTTSNDSNGLPA